MFQILERGSKVKTLDVSIAFLQSRLIPVGFFVFMTGQIWLPNNSSHITQTYIWLLFPSLLLTCVFIRVFKDYSFTRYDLAILGFLLVNILSYFWSNTEEDFGRYFKDGLYILLFMIAVSIMIRHSRIHIGWFLEAIAMIVAVAAMVSIYFHLSVNNNPVMYREFRISSMGLMGYGDFDNPILAGLYYGVFPLILFSRLLLTPWSLLRGGLLLLSILTLQCYVMLTWSRGPMIAMFSGYLVIWLFHQNRKANAVLVVLLAVALSLALAGGMIKQPEPQPEPQLQPQPEFFSSSLHHQVLDKPAIMTDLSSISDLQPLEQWLNKSMNSRGSIWINTLDKISQKPMLGHGIGAVLDVPFNNGLQVARHAHSYYLQIVFDTGLIGLGFFIAVLYFSIQTIWTYRHHSLTQIAAGLLIFGLLGFVSDVSKIFVKPDPFWMLFWLPVAMIIGVRWREQSGYLR